MFRVRESIRALLKCLLTTHTSLTFVVVKELNLLYQLPECAEKRKIIFRANEVYLFAVCLFGRWASETVSVDSKQLSFCQSFRGCCFKSSYEIG